MVNDPDAVRAQSETLGYDALNRLTSVASTADTESYQYDADGNRTQQVVNGVTSTFGYAPGSNQLVSASGGISATYGYDPSGNTTTLDNHVAYTYGPFARLLNAGGTDFVLSAEGQRLEKTSATGTIYFAPGADGTLLAGGRSGAWLDYVWLNGRLVTVIANGGVFPVATDQTGRPLAKQGSDSTFGGRHRVHIRRRARRGAAPAQTQRRG